jgi:hypothetical protein
MCSPYFDMRARRRTRLEKHKLARHLFLCVYKAGGVFFVREKLLKLTFNSDS